MGRADESGAQEEILRRVARDGELGKNDEVGPRRAGRVDAREDQGAVAVEVADDRIDLGESQLHQFSIIGRKPLRALQTDCVPVMLEDLVGAAAEGLRRVVLRV